MVLSPTRNRVFNSPVTVSLPTTVIEMLDRIARAHGQTRSDAIRHAIVKVFGDPESSSDSGENQEVRAS